MWYEYKNLPRETERNSIPLIDEKKDNRKLKMQKSDINTR